MKRLAAYLAVCILVACVAAGCLFCGPMPIYIGSGVTATSAGQDADTAIQAPASQPRQDIVSPLPVFVPTK